MGGFTAPVMSHNITAVSPMKDTAKFIQKYVNSQLNAIVPMFDDGGSIDMFYIEPALDETSQCLSRIISNKTTGFDYLISGHYATFLYYLSRRVWADGGRNRDAARLFLLNKALNGIDLFYEIKMPSVFAIGHTVGMVFGKAIYGERAVFHQGCTVGRSGDKRPVLGAGVVMYPNSAIIGDCNIGENTVLSAGVHVVNTDIPGNCIVFQGDGRKNTLKPIIECHADRFIAPF